MSDKDLNDYIKNHPPKKDTFILCNIAGLEWQMLKDGKVLSAFPFEIDERNTTIATSNSFAVDNPKIIKQIIVAILKEKIHHSISATKKIMEAAGFEDFDIDMEYIIDELKLPTKQTIS